MSDSRPEGFRDPVPPSQLFPGHDDWRPESVRTLAGAELPLRFGAHDVKVSFDTDTLAWTGTAGLTGLPADGSVPYEALPIRDGIVAAVAEHAETSSSTLLLVDFENQRAVAAVSQMHGPTPNQDEQTRLFDASIGPSESEPFPVSDGLVGKRIQWQYSETHTFEHIYLESHLYCWHGITGPERGIAGVEPAWTRLIADDLYLFVWSEITGASFSGALLIDLADGATARSSGRFVAWDDDKGRPWQIVVGASGRVVNETAYDRD